MNRASGTNQPHGANYATDLRLTVRGAVGPPAVTGGGGAFGASGNSGSGSGTAVRSTAAVTAWRQRTRTGSGRGRISPRAAGWTSGRWRPPGRLTRNWKRRPGSWRPWNGSTMTPRSGWPAGSGSGTRFAMWTTRLPEVNPRDDRPYMLWSDPGGGPTYGGGARLPGSCPHCRTGGRRGVSAGLPGCGGRRPGPGVGITCPHCAVPAPGLRSGSAPRQRVHRRRGPTRVKPSVHGPGVYSWHPRNRLPASSAARGLCRSVAFSHQGEPSGFPIPLRGCRPPLRSGCPRTEHWSLHVGGTGYVPQPYRTTYVGRDSRDKADIRATTRFGLKP